MSDELISVIIPVYNVEKYIENTIKSVQAQTYTNWELICVDDCSTDNSFFILKELEKKDNRIKVYKNKQNSGPSKTRNFGIKISKGNYIAFLDSDDTWYKDKLQKQYNFMKINNFDFSFTSYDLSDANGNALKKEVHVPSMINYNELLKNTVISTITVMVLSKYRNDLLMPEEYSNGEDMATWLKLLKKIDYAYGLDEVLSTYRQVRNSLSSGIKNKLTRIWCVYRNIEEISFIKSSYYYIIYIFNVIQKRKKVGKQ